MTGVAERPSAWRTIGRFAVTADSAVVRQFSAATRLSEGAIDDAIPPTFPIVWIGRGEAKSALLAALVDHLDGGSRIMLHVEQTFDYLIPLQLDGRYTLDLSLQAPDPKRLTRVKAEVIDGQSQPTCSFTTTFLIVDPAEGRS